MDKAKAVPIKNGIDVIPNNQAWERVLVRYCTEHKVTGRVYGQPTHYPCVAVFTPVYGIETHLYVSFMYLDEVGKAFEVIAPMHNSVT